MPDGKKTEEVKEDIMEEAQDTAEEETAEAGKAEEAAET